MNDLSKDLKKTLTDMDILNLTQKEMVMMQGGKGMENGTAIKSDKGRWNI